MIKVDKIIPGGQAIGTLSDGKKIFFWNALPDEIVTKYSITKQKSHYTEAIATSVNNPSPYRVSPIDECYLSTSPWQIISYRYELQLKQQLVQEIFREHHIDISLPAISTDRLDYHYRNKMEYALYWDHSTSKIHLAFHQRGSHRKLPISQSSIERPELFARATEIINELNSRHEEARKYQSLLLRCNKNGEVSGGLYENHQPHPVFPPLQDEILGHTYTYSPNGFFQINLPVYELALQEIQRHITTDQVLDLYAGVGTIGLSVARDHHLTLVEVDKFAFSELCANCKKANEPFSEDHKIGRAPLSVSEENGFGAFLPVLSKSEDVTNYLDPDQTVILDPPRAGCDRKLIDKLNEIKPATIIYLSCNPSTQARDVALMTPNYDITTIQTFNFFPRTPHIENLVILTRE